MFNLEALVVGQDIIKTFSLWMLVIVGAMTRTLGVAYVFPLFSWTNLSGPIRIAFAMAMGIPVAYGLYFAHSGTGIAYSLPDIAFLVVKEFSLGAFLGFLLGIPFWGAQSAGDFIDHERGASIANIVDPLHASQTTVLGGMFIQLALALYVVDGGLLKTIDTIYKSYALWPIFSPFPDLSPAILVSFGEMITLLLDITINMAAPLALTVVFIYLLDFFVSRAFEKIHFSSLSVGLKNMMILFFIPTYFLFFSGYFEHDIISRMADVFLLFHLK